MQPSRESLIIESMLRSSGSGTVGRHDEYELFSAFQPIISLAHCRSVGYEALVRARRPDGSVAAPPELFDRVASETELVHLDRLCRAVHISNFIRAEQPNTWLFLNVHPTVSVRGRNYGQFFEQFLQQVGLAPERIVIEILEDSVRDDRQLADAVSFYRERGCLVAIDDFGVGHSNFGRIWQIKPHIVKLDRSTLVFARQDRAARRVLPQLVNLLHEAGCLVLVEGIEDEVEAMLAIESGTDLVQGYYFARPSQRIEPIGRQSEAIRFVIERYRTQLNSGGRAEIRAMHGEELITAAFEVGQFGKLDCPAIDRLLAISGADRCYLIDQQGRQIGESRTASAVSPGSSELFRPLESARDAVWIGRAYWSRAMNQPGKVQITRPYLSLATGAMCVTLSVSFQGRSGPMVLCLDLAHDDEPDFPGTK